MKYVFIVSAVLLLCGSWRRTLLAVGTLGELMYVAWRGLSLGRLPLIGPHDTLAFFAASIGIMALATSLSPAVSKSRWFGFASGFAAGFFALFSLRFPARSMPLPQILDTFWFEAHVVLAFFGYALFVIGGVLCGGFLYVRQRPLLDLQFKTALVGWSFFSASMVCGGIWGYYAWGTYWLWTAKELWTSILWIFYGMHLHLRLRGAQGDTLSAWVGLTGVLVMLFTYLGVSMLMKSSHSF